MVQLPKEIVGVATYKISMTEFNNNKLLLNGLHRLSFSVM